MGGEQVRAFGTAPEGCEPQALASATALIDLVIELAGRFHRRLSAGCAEHGLTESRFAVLRAITSQDTEGCSQNELAERLGLSESCVCALVEQMRAAGLLLRLRSRVDRRRSVLLPTEQGTALSAALMLARDEESGRLLAALSPAQRTQLETLLRILQAVTEPAVAGRPRIAPGDDISQAHLELEPDPRNSHITTATDPDGHGDSPVDADERTIDSIRGGITEGTACPSDEASKAKRSRRAS
jgi:DNA-binding MarR family transcriptional regulator